VFKCETHFHKWGRMQGMKPNDSQVHSHFGTFVIPTLVRELQMFIALVGKANKHQIGPLGYH
jgi:hypothetical protein